MQSTPISNKSHGSLSLASPASSPTPAITTKIGQILQQLLAEMEISCEVSSPRAMRAQVYSSSTAASLSTSSVTAVLAARPSSPTLQASRNEKEQNPIEEAESAFKVKNYQVAFDLLKKAYEKNHDTSISLSTYIKRLGDAAANTPSLYTMKAFDYYLVALFSDCRNADLWMSLGDAAQDIAEYWKEENGKAEYCGYARIAFDKVMVLNPENLNIHGKLGRIAQLEGKWSEAKRHFEAQLNICRDPYTLEYMAGVLRQEVESLLKEADSFTASEKAKVAAKEAEAAPSSTSNTPSKNERPYTTQLATGQLAQNQHRYTDAETHFLQAHRLLPNQVEPLTLLADLAMKRANYIDARKYYILALTKEPGNIKIQLDLAEAHYISAQYEEAERWLKTVCETNPTGIPVYAYWNLGNIAYAQKRFEDAYRFFQEELRIQSPMPRSELYICLGDTAAVLQKHDEALEHYRSAIAIDEKDALYYTKLGATYWILKRHEEALQCYQEGLKQVSHNQCSSEVRQLLVILLSSLQSAVNVQKP